MERSVQFALLCSTLGSDSFGEPIDTNHAKFVDPSRNSLVFVASFELKGDQSTVGVDDPSFTRHLLADGCWCHVFDIHQHSDRAFVLLQHWQHRLARGVFQKPNEPRRAQHSRHLFIGKIDHMLLVDDELAIIESTALLLRESGCTVHAMNNALDAIDFVTTRGDEIDVAVFDYMMPDMTGIELADRVSGLREDLPVLIASGMLDEDELMENKPSNVVSIIHKPYKTQALYQRVREAASRDIVA